MCVSGEKPSDMFADAIKGRVTHVARGETPDLASGDRRHRDRFCRLVFNLGGLITMGVAYSLYLPAKFETHSPYLLLKWGLNTSKQPRSFSWCIYYTRNVTRTVYSNIYGGAESPQYLYSSYWEVVHWKNPQHLHCHLRKLRSRISGVHRR